MECGGRACRSVYGRVGGHSVPGDVRGLGDIGDILSPSPLIPSSLKLKSPPSSLLTFKMWKISPSESGTWESGATMHHLSSWCCAVIVIEINLTFPLGVWCVL